MVMTDLELHRDKELVDLKGRMANSITQFTRGLINREARVDKLDRQRQMKRELSRKPSKKGDSGWVKRRSRLDKEETDDSAGVMHFFDLGAKQKVIDAASPKPITEEDDSTQTEGETTETEDTDSVSTQNIDEIDLKAMYRYACRLMRETLDVEGVCFVDIDGIDWKPALQAPNHRDDSNTDTHTSGESRREFGAASSILGYSHSERFGALQRETWPAIARWDQEAENSKPQNLVGRPGSHSRTTSTISASLQDHSPFMDPETPMPEQTGHSVQDGLYVSATTGSHFDDGGFSNQFLARFLSDNPFGKIFNDGLPDELQDFLPSGVASAILVPIYDFDQHPFAMTCAYSTDKQKWFRDAEKRYLEVYFVKVDLITGFRISNPLASLEETRDHGRSSERHFHLQHLTRTTIPSPRHSSFRRVPSGYTIRHPTTHIY